MAAEIAQAVGIVSNLADLLGLGGGAVAQIENVICCNLRGGEENRAVGGGNDRRDPACDDERQQGWDVRSHERQSPLVELPSSMPFSCSDNLRSIRCCGISCRRTVGAIICEDRG